MRSREGGDEFGLLIFSKIYPLNHLTEDGETILGSLQNTIIKEVEKIDTTEIIDFSKSEIQELLSKMSRDMFNKIGYIPKFPASISSGITTFFEAAIRLNEEIEKQDINLQPREIDERLMGYVQDIPDVNQKLAKALHNEVNLNGDAEQQFFGSLSCRDPLTLMLYYQAARMRAQILKLKEVIRKVAEENKKLKNENAQLKKENAILKMAQK